MSGPIKINLSNEVPTFNETEWQKESKEIADKVREAAAIAMRYSHIGTAQWLSSLAIQLEEKLVFKPFDGSLPK